MAYIIDVYRKEAEAYDKYLDFALFVAFFPQLVAGPIERVAHMRPQLAQPARPSSSDVYFGVERILWGLTKKLIFADRLALLVNSIYSQPVDAVHGPLWWLATVAFGLQIYLDFSGYCDIAIGSARLLGINLVENFNWPYLSGNIAEFWHRWHITLSRWFRDYLYIPLGGNRKGYSRKLVNLMAVMCICGLWHGASLHFVAWGAFHGLCLVVYHLYADKTHRVPRAWSRVPSICLTFITVQVGWVFFRASDLSTAFSIIHKMFFDLQSPSQLFDGIYLFFLVLCAFVVLIHFVRGLSIVPRHLNSTNPILCGAWLGIMLNLLSFFAINSNEKFIYFQF
jgi:alginate O-acetyltransferase complex protein AlgI